MAGIATLHDLFASELLKWEARKICQEQGLGRASDWTEAGDFIPAFLLVGQEFSVDGLLQPQVAAGGAHA